VASVATEAVPEARPAVAAREPIATVAVVTGAEAATAAGRRGRPNMTTRWVATMVGAGSTPMLTGPVRETKGRPDVLPTDRVIALPVAQRGGAMLVRAAITTTVRGSLLRAAPGHAVVAVPVTTVRAGPGREVAVRANRMRAGMGRAMAAAQVSPVRVDMGRAMAGVRGSPVKAGRPGREKAVRVGVLTSGRRRAVTLVRAAPVTLVRGARMTAARAGSPGANRPDAPVTGRLGAMTVPTSVGVTGAG
jgi:hypothetical protein